MIICETQFEQPDPANPDYSMVEVDFYSHVPYGSDYPQHRLTLRKNLKTGEYEVIKVYYKGNEPSKPIVAFKSKSLAEALEFANFQVRWFWGENREPDRICEHKPPNVYWNCRIWAETLFEEKMKIYKKTEEAGT